MFENYKQSYPLVNFTSWFLKWAQPLITKINELIVNNRLRKHSSSVNKEVNINK
jgi:hypothetical protein